MQRRSETLRPLGMVAGDDIIERRTEVLVLDIAEHQPFVPLDRCSRCVALFCQHQAICGVCPSDRFAFTACSQRFQAVLADGLDHAEPGLVVMTYLAQQALVRQRGDAVLQLTAQVPLRVAHSLCPLQGASAGEDREPPEQLLLGLVQQFVAPVEHAAKGLLTRRNISVTGAGQVQPAPETCRAWPGAGVLLRVRPPARCRAAVHQGASIFLPPRWRSPSSVRTRAEQPWRG